MRRRELFAAMKPESRVFVAAGVEIPATAARVTEVDFKAHNIRKVERALAALFLIAASRDPITPQMLDHGLRSTLEGRILEAALDLGKRFLPL
jgi:hypothetical protein